MGLCRFKQPGNVVNRLLSSLVRIVRIGILPTQTETPTRRQVVPTPLQFQSLLLLQGNLDLVL